MKSLLQLTAVFIMLLCGQLCFGQTTPANMNFSELSDSIIKNEVAHFNVKGAAIKQPALNNQLITIPINSCNDTAIHLSKGSTYIDISFKGNIPDRMLDSIFLVTHNHYWVRFPQDAFKGISANHLCNFKGGKKREAFFSPYFKAFHTKDRKRLYIYMQGDKYEVTWVVVNGRYYTCITDSIR